MLQSERFLTIQLLVTSPGARTAPGVSKMPRSIVALTAVVLGLAGCQAPTSETGVEALTPTSQAMKQIPVGQQPHGIAAAQGFVYCSDSGSAQISVIATESDTVVATVPVPEGEPGYLKSFHDGRHVLALDVRQGQLLVIDPAQGHKVVQIVEVGQRPDRIIVGDDDRTVFIPLAGENKLVRLAFETDRAKAPTRQETAVGLASGDHRAAAVAGGWAVVPNAGENSTSLIELKTGEVKVVFDGNQPGPVGIGMAGGVAMTAVVGNVASHTISLFALPSGAKTTLSHVGLSPTEMVLDSRLRRAFVTMAGSNEITVVDYAGGTVVGRVAVGKRPVHPFLAPPLPVAGYRVAHGTEDHGAVPAPVTEVWVGNDDGASVTVIDGETLRVKATVGTGEGHHKIAFWGSKAYVSNLEANNVSVIERSSIH